jgi:tetratricopeptide (TPR) repeat protein
MANKQPKRRGLIANSKRQANDSLRGYRYQMLCSVEAWLALADDEILRLEGVEDFDIVSNNAVTLVQVKDTRRNITLKSKAVIEAINHYWKFRTEHPDLTVKFRFITRSKIGMERGNPFGKDKLGLELWQRCSGDEAAITKISEFLQAEDKISDEVKNFLTQSSPQQIYEQLIEPITWETDSKDASSVERSISDKVLLVGKQYSIPISSHDTKKVVDSLLTKALTVATQQENRVLTQIHFLKIFEGLVSEQYSRRLEMLAEQAAVLDNANIAFMGGKSDVTIQSLSPIQTAIPPLYPDAFRRTDLLTSIHAKLQSGGITIIQGGVDKGKTTLAKLTANDITGDWFWLNFTNKDPSLIDQHLRQLDIAVNNQSGQVNVVLDDLNLQPQQLRTYEEGLSVVVYRVLERGAKLLITSQHKPPNNFIRSLGLSSPVVVHVPNFTISEIEQFARQLGCPAEKAQTWSKLFQFRTKRHPRLVHALLTQLRKDGWKRQDVIESILQTPPELVKELEEAQQLLANLPEDQQEFLYRLSLICTEFRKDYALNISEIPEIIPYPGRVFDQLVDPWMDQIHKTYYILSPLLNNAAEQVWPESKISRLHVEIANSILKAKDLTTIEARAILLHSMRGQNKEGLIAVIGSLMTAPEDRWEILSQEFSWLRHTKIDPPEELFPGDAFVNYCFRSLQYRIAVEVEPEFAPKVLEVWDKETKPHEPYHSYLQSRLMLTAQVLRYNQVSLPAKKLVGYLKEMIDIRASHKDVWKIYLDSMEQLEEHKTGESSIFSILFSFVYARRPLYATFLSDLIDALDELDPEDRTLLLTDFEDDGIESQLLIDSIWLAEANLENPDWTRCLEVFDKVIERTIVWDYPHIAAASARGKAIIHDEKLNDPDAAHKVLQDIVPKVGRLPIIEEEQAVIYLHQKCYKEALNIYEHILPKWNPPSEELNIGPLEEYRQAAICAAHLNDWEKAATFLEEGAKKTQKIENNERYIGLYADAGFAQFKAGNMSDCVKLLNLALQKFETLHQDNTSLKYFTLKKRLTGSIGWVAYHEDENYTSGSEEPSVGFCSNPETNEEVLNLPDYPIGYAWSALAKIEYEFGHGTAVLDHALQVIDWDTDLTSTGSPFFLKIRHDFRNKTFNELPERIHQLANVCAWIKENSRGGKGVEENELASIPIAAIPDFTSVESITVMLVASLLVQLPTGVNIHENLAIWRENSSELPIKENLATVLDLIESMLFGSQNNALTVMKAQETECEEQLAAALKVIHNVETSPANLFFAHILIAIALINSLTWLNSVMVGLAELLSAQWLEKIKFRATLKTPMITVPQIEQACNSSETGKKKIGQILLAVHQAVSVRVAPEILQQFRSWAESESEQKQEPATRKNPAAQRLIKAMEKPPHLTDGDIEALNQSIEEGKMPIKFDSPFESDEREKE